MPTNYTADIENDISFEDYVLGCARAFSATLHQRDDDMKDKPRLRIAESIYYINELSNAKKNVVELEAMKGVNDRTAFGKKVIEEETACSQESFNKKIMLKNKYENMRSKVHNWFPPTRDHENLKNFMIDQINESIDFDCNTERDMDRLTKLSLAKPLDKYYDALIRAYKDVEYYETELMRERERNANTNKWISALYDSLGIEYDTI